MATTTLNEQITKYLTDVHSIEEQALIQMKSAPKIAGDDELARVFSEHLVETEEHERRVRALLEARDSQPSKLKDVAGKAGGVGFVLFARAQPDTPGKLTAHAFSYEHMELAAYDLLSLFAERADEQDVVELAQAIGPQEKRMAERLAANFDRAVEASLREVADDELENRLIDYLADAHAIEAQAIQMLQAAPKIVGESELAKVFRDHLEETRAQQASVEARLKAHDAGPSRLKDAAMRVGALNWGAFFGAQPDTPAKLAGFAYAFEHLEIAAYEELKRVAARGDDTDTVRIADEIIPQERGTAALIHAEFPRAAEATLD
ncbi:MAG TPA: DUF892 family protein [Thermoleophilaceae bacterium]